jgi:integrase/recombinase XerD
MRWENALEGYWLAKARNMSRHTVSDYGITFKRFGQWVKNAEIEKVTAKQVNAFLAHLHDDLNLAPKTVLNSWIALSSFWTWANEEFEIPHIVRAGVEKPKAKSQPMLPYSQEEVKRLLAACGAMNAWAPKRNVHVDGRRPSKLRDVAIMLVLVDSGLRVSELCALTRSDYDKKQGRLQIRHGKGDKARLVFLGQAGQRALWRYLVEREDLVAGAPLFATASGRAMDSGGVRKMIMRAGLRAGVYGASPHRFRHTFAVNFLRNGGNILALQDLLGHSSMEMVRRYARLAEVDLATAQKRASPADNWGL